MKYYNVFSFYIFDASNSFLNIVKKIYFILSDS